MKFYLLLSLVVSNFLHATEPGYVTCNIQGQLGNQMFQAAAAIAYALDHGYEARFPRLKEAIRGGLNIQYVFHRLDVSEFPPNSEFINHYELAYNIYTPILYQEGKNVCMHGYFAFEKYFSHHHEHIRKQFAPSDEILKIIQMKYGEILKLPTVAVHVRTFFEDNIDPNNGIGRTNWKYFINAIDHFSDEYTVLIFSDSPEWIKSHFPMSRNNIHIIEGNPHYIDFFLMSLCNHQVLSPKSTFSWWAAWLNENPNKIVLRPNDGWLGDEAFPASWIKVDIE